MPYNPSSEPSVSASKARLQTITGLNQLMQQCLGLKQTRFALQVTTRTCAALFGGYIAAATLACLLTQILPMPRFESTLTANMLAFLLYAIAIIYAFCVRKSWHAWRDLLLISLVCFALLKLCGQ